MKFKIFYRPFKFKIENKYKLKMTLNHLNAHRQNYGTLGLDLASIT